MPDTTQYHVVSTLGVYPIGENAQVHSRLVVKDGRRQLDLRLFTRKTPQRPFYRSPFGLAISAAHALGFGSFVCESLKHMRANTPELVIGGD